MRESVSPAKRNGQGKNKIKTQTAASPPNPSPILGPGKKTLKDKQMSATGNSTGRIGRPNTRQSSKK